MAISLDTDTSLVSDTLAVAYLQTDPDDELTALFANAATLICEQETSRKLAARDYVDARPISNPQGSKWLLAPEWPINTITRIRVFDSDLANPQTLVVDDDYAYIPDQPWKVLLKDGVWVEGYRIALDYNGGYGYDGGAFNPDEVPNDLVEACLEVMAMIWKHQDGRHFISSSRSIQGITQVIRDEPLPVRARRILGKYKRPGHMGI